MDPHTQKKVRLHMKKLVKIDAPYYRIPVVPVPNQSHLSR